MFRLLCAPSAVPHGYLLCLCRVLSLTHSLVPPRPPYVPRVCAQAEPLVARLSMSNMMEAVVESPSVASVPEGPESCRTMAPGDVFSVPAVSASVFVSE